MFLSPQVEIWQTQPYLGIPHTFPPRARAATRPPPSLEWFLVSEREREAASVVNIVIKAQLTCGIVLKMNRSGSHGSRGKRL